MPPQQEQVYQHHGYQPQVNPRGGEFRMSRPQARYYPDRGQSQSRHRHNPEEISLSSAYRDIMFYHHLRVLSISDKTVVWIGELG